jgi:membrane-bound ClpP family serine protease
MSRPLVHIAARLGLVCRHAAVALLSGLLPRLGFAEIERRLAARPLRDQVAVVGGVLLGLFLLSLLAAQFGWIGMLLFWLGVVIVAR